MLILILDVTETKEARMPLQAGCRTSRPIFVTVISFFTFFRLGGDVDNDGRYLDPARRAACPLLQARQSASQLPSSVERAVRVQFHTTLSR